MPARRPTTRTASSRASFPANSVLGTGRIAGRRVVVCGDDFTVRGGAADAAIHAKQVYGERMARELRLPIVRLVDGTGGGGSVKTYEQTGRTYVPGNPGWDLIVAMLSEVPVVAAALGPVAGLGAARVAHSHFSVMVRGDLPGVRGRAAAWSSGRSAPYRLAVRWRPTSAMPSPMPLKNFPTSSPPTFAP